MKEFKISATHGDVIDAIDRAISPIAATLCGGTDRSFSGNAKSVFFSLPDAYSEYFKALLVDNVAENLLFKVKYDLYAESLPKSEKELFSFLLLRALVFSDFYVSKNLLLTSLKKYDEFNLDGIKNFLLKDEEEEWRAIAYATRKNAFVLENATEFKKLIKCITSTIEGKKETLYLLDGEKPCLVDGDLKKLSYGFSHFDKLDFFDELIAVVVQNLPQKLVIYASEVPSRVNEALRFLF